MVKAMRAMRFSCRGASAKNAPRPGGRTISNATLVKAIAAKQSTDFRRRIEAHFKRDPELMGKVLHLLDSDMLADAKDDTDFLPPSCNNFRLVSLIDLKRVLVTVLNKRGKSALATQLDDVKQKKHLLSLSGFLGRLTEHCAVPSRHIPRLIDLFDERLASPNTVRMDQFAVISNGKTGRQSAHEVVFWKSGMKLGCFGIQK